MKDLAGVLKVEHESCTCVCAGDCIVSDTLMYDCRRLQAEEACLEQHALRTDLVRSVARWPAVDIRQADANAASGPTGEVLSRAGL